ncbi:MAG: Ig-like domain-containing protein [Candidatus Ozemobacteraceae bacterium]
MKLLFTPGTYLTTVCSLKLPASDFAAGANAFIIETPADLTNLNLYANGADGSDGLKGTTTLAQLETAYWTQPCNYVQTADIELPGTWVTVGNTAKPFFGTYNGQGYNITELAISADSNDVGLFGVLDNATGKISNIKVAGHISAFNYDNIGGVVGRLVEGSIENCESKVTITGTGWNIGGVVGYVAAGAKVKECLYNVGNEIADSVTYDDDGIKGTSNIGCIAGLNAGDVDDVDDCQCLNTSHNHRVSGYTYPAADGITLNSQFDAYVQSNIKTTPVAAIVSPADDATGVIVNKPFEVNFSKPMNKATVITAISLTPKKIGNTDDDTTITDASSFEFEWDTTDSQVLISPKTPLAYNRTHTLTIRNTAQDKYGNAIENDVTHTFTTESKISVKSVTPGTATETLPITFLKETGFVVTFSDPLTTAQQESVVSAVTIKDETGPLTYSHSWNNTGDYNVLTLKTTDNSEWDNAITLTIGGLTEDGGDLSAISHTHIVQTVLQPKMEYRAPVGLTGYSLTPTGVQYLDDIKLNEAIVLRFNKPMDTSAANAEKIIVSAYNLLDDEGDFDKVLSPYIRTWSPDGRVLTINNENADRFWEYNASYTVTVPTTILDADSYNSTAYKNNLDEAYSFEFKTTTEISVVKAELNPNIASYKLEDYMDLPIEYLNENDTYLPLMALDGSNAAARIPGPGLKITFSQNIHKSNQQGIQDKIKLYKTVGVLPSNVLDEDYEPVNPLKIENVPLSADNFTWEPNSLTGIKSIDNLEYDSYYILRITGMTDANGFSVKPFVWFFKTVARPVVTGVSPASGFDNALVNQAISMSFDKPMKTDTVSTPLSDGLSVDNIKLYEVADETVDTATDHQIALIGFTWAADHASFIALPGEELESDTKYYVEYSKENIRDARENALDEPGSDKAGWYFITSQNNGIKRVSPIQGEKDVQPNRDIVIELESVPEEGGTYPEVTVEVMDGENGTPITDVATPWVAADGKTYTRSLPDFEEFASKGLYEGKTIRVTVVYFTNYTYTFTTTYKPKVVANTPETLDIPETRSPAPNSIDVNVTEPIVLAFDKPMNPNSINGIKVTGKMFDGNLQDVASLSKEIDDSALLKYEWSTWTSSGKGGSLLKILPTTNLTGDNAHGSYAYNTEYSISFTNADVKDNLGNALFGAPDLYNWKFTTKAGNDPVFSDFVIERNKLNLAVSYDVNIEDGIPITKHGVAYKKVAEETWTYIEAVEDLDSPVKVSVVTKPVADGTIAGSGGKVALTLTGFDQNEQYQVKPWVSSKYGSYTTDNGANEDTDKYVPTSPAAQTFVIHPFNFKDNASNLAKTTETMGLENPFIIETAADLTALADTGVAAYWTTTNLKYLQIANVAADDKSISVVGSQFAAQYNGGGFTISGGTVPMFAYLDTGAVVENVNLTAVNIAAGANVGGIVAEMTAGTVKNCQVEGTTITGTTTAGGIAGIVTAGTISGNVVTCPVKAPTAGGIAGSVTAGDIRGNTNNAAITETTTGGCITAVGGNLTDNVCLKHDHKAQVNAEDGVVTANTDQTYLVGALKTVPTVSGTVHAGTTVDHEISGATNVSTSTQLIFTFDKPMDQIKTQDSFSLKDASANAVTCEFSWATKDNDSASVLTVTPKTSGNQSVALLPHTVYTAKFTNAKDIFGVELAETTYTFTTAFDVSIAKVVVKSGDTVIDDTTTDTTTSDRKDVANVPVNSIIEIYFTDALNTAQEAIVESTDNVKLAADDLNTAGFEAVDTEIATLVLDGDKKILTVTPSGDLPYASKLVLSLANLTDANGNTLATFNYSFVTASQPVVVGHVPAKNAQFALPEAPISISFSKPIDTTTVTAASFVLKQLDNDSNEIGSNLLDNTNVTWSEDFMTVTASPAAKLDYDTNYRVTLTTAVTDNDALLKNALIEYTYDFKTVKQTGIKSVAPVQNAVNVKIGTADTKIVLTLEKEQAGSAPKLAIKKLLGESVFTYVDVAETDFTTHDAGTNVYTYTYTLPAALPNNSVMQVTFSNLLDDNGYLIDYGFDNELSGENTRGKFIYTFNTATQPVVITATPTSDITKTGQVDVTEPIVITFSKKMDTTDTNTLVTVTENAVDFTANCDYVWSGGNTVLTITPKAVAGQTYKGVFKYSSEYVVTLAAGLKDDSALGGNAIDQRTDIDLSKAGVQTNTFTFKTKSSEAPELSPLKVVRDRRVLTTSFTAVVNDNGAPINTAAGKVGVIVQTDAETPTSVPADQVVKATIGKNGYISCVLDPDTDVNLTMDDNTPYYLYPYVETTYGNDTFFAGDPVTVVLHPFNLEDNASDLAKTTATISDNPFIIETAADLTALADTAVTAYWTSPNLKYLQIASIEADDKSISAVGNKFAAQYNGGGFTISGGSVPMFAYLDTGAVVENVMLTGLKITTGETVGGIVAEMTDGTVKNCEVVGTAITGTTTAGGIAGIVTAGTISGNVVTCPVKAPTAGGIAGSVTAGDIRGNTNNAAITETTTGGCITAEGGTLTDNVCLIHDHKAQVKADGSITENTDQTYLVGSIIVNPVIELASTTIPVNSDWTDLKDIGSSTQLVFTFSKPMDYKATEDAFTLNDGANDIPVSFAWSTKSDDSASVLTVIPVSPLSAETIYTAEFVNAEDIFGNKVSGSYAFTTSTDVSVNKVTVHNGADNKDITYRVDTADVPVNASFTIHLNGALPAENLVVTIVGRDLNTNVDLTIAENTDFTVAYNATKTEAYIALLNTNTWSYAASHTISITSTNANSNAFDYIYHFTTASQPVVIGHTPAADAKLALTNGAITIAFSKPMDTDSVELAISGVTLGNWVWSSDNTTVSATPTARLAYNTEYTVTVAVTAEDADALYQNALRAEYSWSFTTGEDSGIDSIYAAESSDGKTVIADTYDVATDSLLVVEFKDKLNANQKAAGRPVFALSPAVGLTAAWDANSANSIASLTPDSKLSFDTTYTLTVSELYDANGFKLDNITYSFKTASQPYIVSVYPAKDSTTMKPTDPIVVHFSKRMDSDVAAQFTLARAEQGGADLTYTDGTMAGATDYTTALSADGKILTFTPVANIKSVANRWDYNTKYTITGTAADIKDSLGNSLTDINTFLGSAFTTVYSSDVATFTFGANDLDTPIAYFSTDGITVTFTEPLSTAQKTSIEGAVKLYTQVGADVIKTPAITATTWTTVGDATANKNDSILTITSVAALDYSASCTVEIGGLTDENGSTTNVPARYFTFHTTAQPVVVSVSPASGTTVLPGNSIMVTFSKPMDKTSVVANTSIKLQKYNGAVLEDMGLTFLAGDNSWSVNDTVLNASPSARLEYGGKYKVTVTSAVEDANDNPMAADFSWEFTVHARTGIEAVSPVENAVAVRKDATISVTMVKAPPAGDEPQIAFEKLIGDTDYTTAAAVMNWADTVGTIDPADFPNNSLIKATISNIKDENGYLLDYGFAPGVFEYTFNTATMPVVVSATPTSDITVTGTVDVTEPIVITFSKAMDTDSTNTLVTITENGNPFTANCDYVWSGDNTVLTITPKPVTDETYKGVFKYSSEYVVTLAGGLKDAAALGGNAIDQRIDIDLSNAGLQIATFSFNTKSSEAPEFSPLNVVRDRRVLTTSFTAVVNDNGAPIDTAADKVGVIVQDNNITPPVAVPVTQVVKATIGENGYITCVLDPDADANLTMDDNTVYYLYPYVETTYGNDTAVTFFASAPVTVVLHPWNLEDNAADLAKTTTGLSLANPFIIGTTADLSALADTTVTAYWTSSNLKYLQIANVTADNTSISDVDNQFAAQYNGGGFTISGGTVPMFAYLTTGAVVENVMLTAVNIDSADQYVGGIVANMTAGTVKNNQVAGTVVKSTHVTGFAGGIAGIVTAGTISGNVVTCPVTAPTAGGIAGSGAAGAISGNTNNSVVKASVTGGCITAVGGTLTDNVCLIHDHKAQVKADGSITENTDQTYLVGSIIVNPVIELASTTIPVNSDWTDLKDIGSSTQLVFTFSKPMDYKATEDAFALTAGANDIPVSFAWSTKSDDSASVLTVIPVSPLSAETIYKAEFVNAEDIFGNKVSGSYAFTTSTDVSVNKVTVHNGADNKDITYRVDTADVPVNASFTIHLNGALPAENLVVTIVGRDLNTNVDLTIAENTDFTVAYNATKTEAYIALLNTNTWSYAASHTISITSTNANSNAFDYIYHFTTASQPVVIGHTPAADAKLALTNGAITIAFSKPMDTASVEGAITVKDSADNPVALGDWVWNSDNTTVSATPTARLAYNTEYTVTVAVTAEDADALYQNALRAEYSWSFTTGEDSGIDSIYAAESSDGKTVIADTYDVATDSLLVVEFKDKLNANQKAAGRPVFALSPAVGLTAAWDANSANSIASLTPDSKLSFDTTYTLTVSELYDANGFKLDNITYSFKTASQPYIVSVYPAKDSTTMKPTDPIVVHFSKRMDSDVAAQFTLARAEQGGADLTYTDGTMAGATDYTTALSADGKILTFTPVANIKSVANRWDYNTKYTITGTAADIKDSLGNSLTDINSFLGSAFTTVYSSDVATFTFGANELDTPVAYFKDTGITVTFTEPLSTAQKTAIEGAVRLYTQVGADAIKTPAITASTWTTAGDGSANENDSILTITSVAALDYSATCTVEIGGLTDENGSTTNVPARYFTFHTTAQPEVVSVSPASGSKFALTNGVVVVGFSKAIATSTFAANTHLELYQDAGSGYEKVTDGFSGNLTWDSEGRTVTASPSVRLDYNGKYQVVVQSTTTDAAGNAMAGNYSWTFETGARSDISGIVLKSEGTAVDNLFDAPVDSVVVIDFAEALVSAQQDSVTVTIEGVDKSDSSPIGSITMGKSWTDNKTLTATAGVTLEYYSKYTVTISNLKDANGFVLPDVITYDFQTASQPYIVSVYPANGSATMKPTDPIIVHFSKRMDSAVGSQFTLNRAEQGGADLTYTNGDMTVTTDYTTALSADGKILTFTPVANIKSVANRWDYNTKYTITGTAADIKDSLGNSLTDINSFLGSAFTTVYSSDVATFTFGANELDTPVAYFKDTGITVTFTEPLSTAQKTAIEGAVRLYTQVGADAIKTPAITASTWTTAGDGSANENDSILTITSVAALDYSATCTVEIGGLTDENGSTTNVPARYFTFHTTAQPEVVSVSPASGSKFALTNGVVVVGFSKAIATSTFAANTHLELYQDAGSGYEKVTDGFSGNLTWDSEGRTVTASPSVRLDYNGKYQVVVQSTTTDAAGNAMAGNYSWTFETGARSDISGIVLKSEGTAVDNLFDAPVDSVVVIDFAEALVSAQQDSVTVTIEGVDKSDSSPIGSITMGKSWTDNKTLTATAGVTLEYYSKYTVTISNLKDANGFVLPDVITYDFQTASQPYIVSVYPANGSATMKPTDPIIVHFSKRMDSAVGSQFTLNRAEQGGADLTYTNGDMTVTTDYTTALSADGKILTFTPVANIKSVANRWDYNTKYTITGTAADIKDSLGNSLTDINSFLGSAFTTVYSSDVATFTFGANELDTPVAYFKDTGITVTFTEPLSTAQKTAIEGAVRLYTQVGADAIKTPAITASTWTTAGDGSANENDSILTITSVAALDYSATCTVEIGGLTDENGSTTNVPARYFTFHTTAQPEVVSVSPASGSKFALTNGVVVVGFSKAIATSTFAANTHLELYQDAGSGYEKVTDGFSGNLTWDSEGRTVTASPSVRLDYNGKYQVVVQSTTTDAAGNAMAGNYSWTFETGARSDISGIVLKSEGTAVDNLFDAPVDSVVVIDFAEALVSAQQDSVTVTIEGVNKSDSSAIDPITMGKFWADNKTLTATSGAILEYYSKYTVTISNLKDANGFVLPDVITYNFQTASQPCVISVVPSGSSVDVSDKLVVTFSKAMDKDLTAAALTLSGKFLPTSAEFDLTTAVTASYTVTWSGDDKIMTVTPSGSNHAGYIGQFDFNTTYTLAIADTAKDALGNGINAALADYAFTTVGRIRVDDISFVKTEDLDLTDVPVASMTAAGNGINVTFADALTDAQKNIASAAVKLSVKSDTTDLVKTIDNATPANELTATWSGNNVLTIVSTENLLYNASCTLEIGGLTDDRGNLLYNASCTLEIGGLTDDRGVATNVPAKYYFQTTSQPEVVSVSPASGTTVLPGNSIMVTFSKSMDKDSVVADTNIILAKETAPDTWTDLDLTNISWSVNDTVLNASPSVRLEYGGKYKVIIASSVADATDANNPMGTDYSWEFSVHDRTGIEAVSPIENAVAVRTNAEIAITMVKAPAVGNGPKIAFATVNGTAYTAGPNDLSWADKVGTIDPDDFPNNTLIKATLSNLKDDNGYLLDYGFAPGVFEYTFNTATMPTVVHRSPLKDPDTTPVAITEPIVIVFDKPMDEDTLTFENITVTEDSYGGNAPRELGADDFTYSYSASANGSYMLTITPKAAGSDFAVDGQFPYNSRYTVSFTNANIKDAAALGGNPLDGAYDWSFTTVAETTPLFGNFTISRDRTTLTADYVVSSEAGPDITKYGYEISHDNATWVPFYTDTISAPVNGVTIVTSAISKVNGQVTMSFSGFTNNTTYYIKPYITTAYGVGTYAGDTRQFVVHPFNLIENYNGANLTASVSDTNRYLIENYNDIAMLANKDISAANYWVANNYYVQTSDITLTSWEAPIGVIGTAFNGNYSGNGKTVTFPDTFVATETYFGLFGSLDTATVSGLTLDGVSVTSNHSTRLGALAGNSVNSAISNVNVVITADTLASTAANSYVGALAGHVTGGSVNNINVILNGKLAAVKAVGGVVGYAVNAELENCRVTLGHVDGISASAGHAGGVAGELAGELAGTSSLKSSSVVGGEDAVAISAAVGGNNCAGGVVGAAVNTNVILNNSLIAKLKLTGDKRGCVVGAEIGAVGEAAKFSGNTCLWHDSNDHPVNVATYSYMVSNVTYAPAVQEISPAHNATDVAVNAPVVVNFSKPMDIASTEAAFKLIANETDVASTAFTFNWSNDYRTLTAVPKANLLYNTKYEVVIATTAKDRWSGENQQALQAYAEHTFTTLEPVPPKISPVTYHRAVDDNGTISVVASFAARVEDGTPISTATNTAGIYIGNADNIDAATIRDAINGGGTNVVKGSYDPNSGVTVASSAANVADIPLNTTYYIYPYVTTTDGLTHVKTAAPDKIIIHPFNGTGTQTDPFTINSLTHLKSLVANPIYWASHFVQTATIDASAEDASAVAASIGTIETNFTGTYNGGNNIIDNYKLPMFGVIDGAKISNIVLTDVSITNDVDDSSIGALVGEMVNGTVTSCNVTAIIAASGDNAKAGGLVGAVTAGTLSDNTVTATVTVTDSGVDSTTIAGGLVGDVTAATISNNSVTATVTGADTMGCVAGDAGTLTENACHNTSHTHPMGKNEFMVGNLTSVPAIRSIVPANAATGIAVTSPITITFDKPMDAATITAANLTVTPADHDGLAMAWDEAQQVLTITPKTKVNSTSPLKYGTEYTVSLTNDTATDIFGNKKVPAYSSTFTTEKGNPPTLTSLEFNVLGKTSAQFAFNYYVNAGAPVTDPASIGVQIATDYDFNGESIVATLTPTVVLDGNTLDNLLVNTNALTRGTTYFARAFATNTGGTATTLDGDNADDAKWNIAAGTATTQSVKFTTPKLDKDGEYYTITNEAELKDIKTDSSLKFILGNDITLTEAWVPPADFSGVLVGNGKTITTPGAFINSGLFDTLSGTVGSLTIKLSDSELESGLIKTLSGSVSDLVVDGTALNTTVTIGNDEGIVANTVTATGVISNTKVTENITVASVGGATSGGCFAGTVAAGGMVPAQSVGNICLAAGHNHAKGDTLVNNLKTAPKLVNAVFVSKSGKEGVAEGGADRVFGDWATDIRVAGNIEMTFTFDKAMDLTGSFGIVINNGAPLASGTDYNVFFSDSKTAKVVIASGTLDYATEYAVTLTPDVDGTNEDTLENVFAGYYIVDSARQICLELQNYRRFAGNIGSEAV